MRASPAVVRPATRVAPAESCLAGRAGSHSALIAGNAVAEWVTRDNNAPPSSNLVRREPRGERPRSNASQQHSLGEDAVAMLGLKRGVGQDVDFHADYLGDLLLQTAEGEQSERSAHGEEKVDV